MTKIEEYVKKNYKDFNNPTGLRVFYDKYGYEEKLEKKYEGTVLLTQYKLSYSRENRIQVSKIYDAIDTVYQREFHIKQFKLTAKFAGIYLACLFVGFYAILKVAPTDPEKKRDPGSET